MVALVAAQFGVHALGWSMAARMFRDWSGPEGQFALCWLVGAAGLMLYVPPLPPGHGLRGLGNLMAIAGTLLLYRGLARYWGERPADRAALGLLAFVAAAQLATTQLERPHAARVALLSAAVGIVLVAVVVLTWRHGRRGTPLLAATLAVSCGVLALLLFVRAGVALAQVLPEEAVVLDATGRINLALVVVVLVAGGMLNLVLVRLVLDRMLQRLLEQAQTDSLTGLANRRGLMTRLADLHHRAQRGGHGYALMLADIDHFKAVNDRHGHAVGDQVLRRVATHLREQLRSSDVVARWGGEEFCVLLPRTALADARGLAERVALHIAGEGEPRVTISVGIDEARPDDTSADPLLQRADAALYAAKAGGRNRVCVAEGAALSGEGVVAG